MPREVQAFTGAVEAVGSRMPLAHGARFEAMPLCLGPFVQRIDVGAFRIEVTTNNVTPRPAS
jgi:hypothetical protein